MTKQLRVGVLVFCLLFVGACSHRETPMASAPVQDSQMAVEDALGIGPGQGGDRYDKIDENVFQAAKHYPLSTFSIDVDTASYANVRRFINAGQLPPPGAVRIEEMVNYFAYEYDSPTDETPFATDIEVAGCPWKVDHRVVRICRG